MWADQEGHDVAHLRGHAVGPTCRLVAPSITVSFTFQALLISFLINSESTKIFSFHLVYLILTTSFVYVTCMVCLTS
jgi:hypothetical protein